MDNLNAANNSICEGEFIVTNELRIDESNNIKTLAKSELESETSDCPKGAVDNSPENREKDICDGVTASKDMSSSRISCISEPAFTKSSERNQNVSDRETNDTKEDDQSEAKGKSAAGFAFIIEFNEGKAIDNKKHREIVERFQNRQQQQMQQRRHKRGVSLSKLDDSAMRSSLPAGTSIDDISAGLFTKPPFKEKQMTRSARQHQSVDSDRESTTESNVVVLRRRPQNVHQAHNDAADSTFGNKRHSWSPRTSLKDEVVSSKAVHSHRPEPIYNNESSRKKAPVSSFLPKSATLQKALETGRPKTRRDPSPKPKQLMDAKLDVITTPLEYVKLSDDGGSVDAVSEAGTYTLDGDHYTEEEKERMSIDKESSLYSQRNARQFGHKAAMSIDTTSSRNEKNKRLKGMSDKNTGSASAAGSSVISLLSKHTPEPAVNSHKVSYLEKIKSRFKTIGDNTFHKLPLSRNTRASSETPTASPREIEKDVGTFTSVTACGVLNKSTNPSARKHRKSSLTKLQIDASEYIQPNYKTDDNMMKSYTDYEKAKQNEYQLNIFSTASSTSQIQSECYGYEPLESERPSSVTIKTAPTKNDWIQEWARNARRRNFLLSAGAIAPANSKLEEQNGNGVEPSHISSQMSRSDDFVPSYRQDAQSASEFGDEINPEDNGFPEGSPHPRVQQIQSNCGIVVRKQSGSSVTTRPPVSPTKIPSPMHSSMRVRGTSANRSFRSSFSELDQLETEIYLEKTAEAISSLKKLHRNNNSPNNTMRQSVPRNFASSPLRGSYEYEQSYQQLYSHKRNLSLDGTTSINAAKFNYGQNGDINSGNGIKNSVQGQRGHVRHNSHENRLISLDAASSQRNNFDQTSPSQRKKLLAEHQRVMNKYAEHDVNGDVNIGKGESPYSATIQSSPIRRSTSFSTKQREDGNSNELVTSPVRMARGISSRTSAPVTNGKGLQKSTSSSSFKKMALSAAPPLTYRNTPTMDDYSSESKYYTNDDSDFNSNDYSNENDQSLLYLSDDSDDHLGNPSRKAGPTPEVPITHTRFNKAFLMRVEQSKQIAGSVPSKGQMACPNTPEMPRRNIAQRASFRDRTSMPRDSSLSRIKQDLPNLKTMKKALTTESPKAAASTTPATKSQLKVLPKYMDISKYKSNQGQGTFLRRDESKSTLINRTEIKKSPSAIGLSKMEFGGSSAVRVKSAGAKPTSASAKEIKAREAELAMWRRRATYDPMKAAAEGRKKLEAPKKGMHKLSDSSAVMRSQSFHSGVGQFNDHQIRAQFSENRCNASICNTESLVSSEEEEEFVESS